MTSRHRDLPGTEPSLGLSRRQLLRLAGGTALAVGSDGWLTRLAFAAVNSPGTVLAEFSPPANWEDFPPGALRDALHEQWSLNVNQWTDQAILGNPWTSSLDQNRNFYFNPLTTPIPPGAITKRVEWIAFPNRITTYLGAPRFSYSQDQLFEFAENGRLADGTTLPPIPTGVCPFLSSEPFPTMPYGPPGPRGWQDEYCEWAVERDGAGEIVRAMFTCENPEYWYTLWSVSPERVLELYQQLVSPRVKMDDLVLKGADGKPVREASGQLAYNPLNQWNNTTRLLPDSGGAVHLTSPPNNLGAEIGLGAAATIWRYDELNPQDLVCCTPFGQPFRHSDPHIGYTVNEGVRALGQRITIANPVGLYLQPPNFENVELPADWVKAGLSPADFWTLERGTPGLGLHAVFRAPKGHEKLKLSQIKINGSPLRWAAQLTTTFEVGLHGTFIPAGDTPAQTFLACPNEENPVPNRPAPYQLIRWEVAQAFLAANLTGDSSTAAPRAKRGTTLADMLLVTSGTTAETPIVFPGGGVRVTKKRFLENQCYHVPGNTNGGTFNLFILDLEIASDAPLGQRSLRLGSGYNAAAPAFLTLVDG